MLRQLNRKLDKQIVRNSASEHPAFLAASTANRTQKNKYNGRVYENDEDSVEEYMLDYEDEEEVGDEKDSDYDYSRSEYDEDKGGGQIQFKSKTMIFENERVRLNKSAEDPYYDYTDTDDYYYESDPPDYSYSEEEKYSSEKTGGSRTTRKTNDPTRQSNRMDGFVDIADNKSISYSKALIDSLKRLFVYYFPRADTSVRISTSSRSSAAACVCASSYAFYLATTNMILKKLDFL